MNANPVKLVALLRVSLETSSDVVVAEVFFIVVGSVKRVTGKLVINSSAKHKTKVFKPVSSKKLLP